MIDDADLADVDRAALKLAFGAAMDRDAETRDQLRGKLAQGDSWIEAAMLAAYSMQNHNLRLNAAQEAPMHINDPDETLRQRNFRDSHDAAKMLRAMLALGISRYHPDPVRAIAAAQGTRVG